MMRVGTKGRFLLAFLWVGLQGAAHGDTNAPSLAERAREAGTFCKSNDSSQAATSLRALLDALDASGEPSQPLTTIVSRYLDCLEPNRTHDDAQPQGPNTQISSDQRRALRQLRPCARACLNPPKTRGCSEDQFLTNLTRAVEVARTGLESDLKTAATLAECARTAAHTPNQIMYANEAVAKIALQRGDETKALRAAQDAAGAARFESDLRVRIEMARLLTVAGDLERAGAEFEALEPLATTPAVRAKLLVARGDFLLRLGSPSQALPLLLEALREHEARLGRDHLTTAAVLQLVGDAHRQRRDFANALSAYREALAVRRKELGPAHPETAATQNAIGVLYVDFKNWPAAMEAFASVASDLGNALGSTHPRTLAAHLNNALAAWGGSHSVDAAGQYRKAVNVFEAALGSDHPKVAAAIRSLARIELERGEPEVANRLLEKALSAQRLRLGNTHPDTTLTLLEQGQLLARSGKLKESAAKLCATLPELERAYGPEHPLVARYRMLLSRITVARGAATSCPKAEGMTTTSAWDEAFEAGRVVALHLQRSFGAMTERQRQVFARDSLEVVGTLLSAPRASTTETYLATLPHRDSVLRSIASSRAAEFEDDSKTRQIRSELKRKRRRYVTAVLGGTAEFAQRAVDLAREIDELTAAADRTSNLATSDPRKLLADACARLPDDAAVIEFIEYDLTVRSATISTVPRYVAFVIRGDDCRVLRIDLGSALPVAQMTERLDEAMNSGGYAPSGPRARPSGEQGIGSSSGSPARPPADRSDWRELSRLLLAPLTEATRGLDRWLVIPDSSLWGVPLGALPDPLNEDRFLLERVVVGYLTSLYEVANFTPRQVALFSKPLLFGAPDFGTNKTGPRVLTADGPCSILPFDPLPGTLAELEDLRQVLGKSIPMVIGAEATKEHFLDALQAKPSLVHLATHGYFAGRAGCYSASEGDDNEWDSTGLVDTNPLLLSGMVFAGANLATRIEAEGTSGILTAYEVAGLDLRQTRLLVLSACDTGTGLHQRAQEVQGMRWGFRAAGANALVVSLWPADDNVTPMLMRSFYQALKTEKPTDDLFRGAEALNHALKEVGSQFRDHPVLWANFVFSGIL